MPWRSTWRGVGSALWASVGWLLSAVSGVLAAKRREVCCRDVEEVREPKKDGMSELERIDTPHGVMFV